MKEMSGFNDSNDEYFYSNYKISESSIIESWIVEEKNIKGMYRVDWGLVGENYIENSKVYTKYLSNGFSGSKINLGKKLFKLGILPSQKTINGLNHTVYVGITDKISADFIDD